MEAENLRRMKQEEAKVEEYDERDIYDIWDIMVEDVERLRQILTPSVHTFLESNLVVQPCMPLIPAPDEVKVVRDKELNNDVDIISIQAHDDMDDAIQPSIPQNIHTTPPDKDYVAPTTKSILDELLEEFRDDILNVTVADEEDDFNPTKYIKELERLLAKDPQSYFKEIQVHLLIIKTNDESEPFIHTRPLSPLYGTFKSSKSSTKPYKVQRELISPIWFLQLNDGWS
ncbi:hypothetical protein Tco_0233768 [Tanacetum coccineum]